MFDPSLLHSDSDGPRLFIAAPHTLQQLCSHAARRKHYKRYFLKKKSDSGVSDMSCTLCHVLTALTPLCAVQESFFKRNVSNKLPPPSTLMVCRWNCVYLASVAVLLSLSKLERGSKRSPSSRTVLRTTHPALALLLL